MGWVGAVEVTYCHLMASVARSISWASIVQPLPCSSSRSRPSSPRSRRPSAGSTRRSASRRKIALDSVRLARLLKHVPPSGPARHRPRPGDRSSRHREVLECRPARRERCDPALARRHRSGQHPRPLVSSGLSAPVVVGKNLGGAHRVRDRSEPGSVLARARARADSRRWRPGTARVENRADGSAPIRPHAAGKPAEMGLAGGTGGEAAHRGHAARPQGGGPARHRRPSG